MAEPFLWGLLAVNVAWLALNVWHTRQNNRDADENLSIARDIQRQLGKVEVLNRAATRGVSEAPAPAGPPVPRYSGWLFTHVVKGGDYRMLGEAKLQTDKPLSDMAEVVVYQGADGKLWAREKHEYEARFSRTRPDPYGVTVPGGQTFPPADAGA